VAKKSVKKEVTEAVVETGKVVAESADVVVAEVKKAKAKATHAKKVAEAKKDGVVTDAEQKEISATEAKVDEAKETVEKEKADVKAQSEKASKEIKEAGDAAKEATISLASKIKAFFVKLFSKE
jgi:molecular chaperone GrpE (heat shock protein)